jgi:hypothetical protein
VNKNEKNETAMRKNHHEYNYSDHKDDKNHDILEFFYINRERGNVLVNKEFLNTVLQLSKVRICIYVNVCMYILMYTYTYTYVNTHTCVYLCKYICVCLFIFIHTEHTHIHLQSIINLHCYLLFPLL